MSTAVIKDQYLDPVVAQSYDGERFTSLAGRWLDRLEFAAICSLLSPLAPTRRLGLFRFQRAPGKRLTPDYGWLTAPAGPGDGAQQGGAGFRVLDAACGTGRITLKLAKLGFNVTGGDISSAMMDVARQRLNFAGLHADFARIDLDDLRIGDGTFDLVTCIRVMHHLPTESRARVLKQLARASNRYVMINLSLCSPWHRLRRKIKRALGQSVSRDGSTWEQVHAETAAAGLKVVRSRWVLPGVSEDLFVLMEKTESVAGNVEKRKNGGFQD